jgi:2-C-methyl-D-erythritol 4-phosphate cytidylyltransferase
VARHTVGAMTSDAYDVPERPPALGTVVDEGRGSLPYALVHGEALVACAAWALGAAGVTAVDVGTEWAGILDAEEAFVLHDSLCPMTPADFIAACVRTAHDRDAVVVGVRPVTDTVKTVEDGYVGATVDRSSLLAVASPVVLPPSVVAALDSLPSLDFAELVAALRDLVGADRVLLTQAPPSARRVASPDDLAILEALTSPG